LPPQFGRYRVIKKLGGGGMGTVYLVENTELEREEALKVPHFSDGDDPQLRERFLREAKSAAKLDHANLCPIYDVGVQDGTYYLTMRLLKGKLLSDYAGKAQPSRKSVEIVTKLAQALEAAHVKGVIHRDLKPSNIMMVAGVGPVVMDFGLAKQVRQPDAKLTQAGSMLGTPAYMPPEQLKGELERMGPASDVYSLGVILYELLTGRLPFEGTTAMIFGQILYTEPPLPSALVPGLNPTLDGICRKAMAKAATERYASMKALAAALLDYLRSTPATEAAGNLIPTTEDKSAVFQAATVAPKRQPAGISDAFQAATVVPQTAKLDCPACQKSLKLEWRVRGRTLSCPACGAELRVANDLSALTLPTTDSGDVRDSRPEDFWEVERAPASQSSGSRATRPITASEIPTGRSRVVKRPPKPSPEPKTRILIGAGILAVLLVLVSTIYLVTTAGKNTKTDTAISPSGTVAPQEEDRIAIDAQKRDVQRVGQSGRRPTVDDQRVAGPQATPLVPAPVAVVAKSESKQRDDNPKLVAGLSKAATEDARAVYDIELEPANARLSVDGASVSISGVGPKRRIIVSDPNSHAPITLIAAADGFQEVRRGLNPHPGLAEQIVIRLEPVTPGRVTAADNADRHALPGGANGPTGQQTSAAAAKGAVEWKLVSTIPNSMSDIQSIALSNDGTRVASGGADRTLQIWDAGTGVLRGRVERGGEVGSVAFFKDGKRLLCSVAPERKVEIWKESTLSIPGLSAEGRHSRPRSNRRVVALPLLEFKNDLNQELGRATLGPDEKLLASAGNSGIVTIWDVARAIPLRQAQHGLVASDPRAESSPPPGEPAFGRSPPPGEPPFGRSPPPGEPAFGRSVRRARSTGRPPRPPSPTKTGRAILSLAFSPDGRQLACGGESGGIALCNVSTGQRAANLQGHTAAVLNLAYSRNGRYLASAGSDRTLRIWDADQRKEWRVFDAGVGEAVAFSHLGNWIAAAAEDNTVRVWNVESPNEVAVLSGHTSNITHIVFSSRGTRLATADRDRTIRIWDILFPTPTLPDSPGSLSANVPEAKPRQVQRSTENAGAWAGIEPGQARADNGLKMALVWIPPGAFRMGSEIGPDHQKNEGPVQVKLTDGFWLGKFELTRAEWRQVMGTNPWDNLTDDLNPVAGDNHPATHITWENAVAFCQKLTEDERSVGRLPADWEYTLPTEAQWEYACRAGTTTPYYSGKTLAKLLDSAWFKGNLQKDYERHAQLVGSRTPNPWGLYDMHGNVSEWCRDWYVVDPPGGTDPEVSSGANRRVIRGGNWRSAAEDVRSAYRTGASLGTRSSAIGFRVVAVPVDSLRHPSPTQPTPGAR
jgi:serine/threonine protein kinase/formylglycine-generating enzyme required for sulfatase activity